jgi:hypothetical protein
MKTLVLAILLGGPVLPAATELTCNDLALLRIIFRQDMARDADAAGVASNALDQERAAPLKRVSDDPNQSDWDTLRALVADPNADEYRRLNAARVLAYFGDRGSVDLLSKTVQGLFAAGRDEDKGKAALCLVYLERDLPERFAFSGLAGPRYSELDIFVKKSNPPVDANAPYTAEDVQTMIGKFLGMGLSFEVRGPLSVAEVEQEQVIDVLCEIAQYNDMRSIPRLPFAYGNEAWQDFKAQVQENDLIYFFTSDKASWRALIGREGYALIRGRRVIHVFITAMS